MITSLEDPIIDIFKINLNCSPRQVGAFVKTVMDSPEMRAFHDNPDGGPGVFIYDPMKPLEGLASFGYESLENIRAFYGADSEDIMAMMASVTDKAIVEKFLAGTSETAAESEHREDVPISTGQPGMVNGDPASATGINVWSPPPTRQPLEEGDLIILQARPRNVKLSGGSTSLGRLRSHIYKSAVAAELIEPDPTFNFLWVVDFPLFTPSNSSDPGQGGSAGFSSTHHPFTSPKTPADMDLLHTDPLRAVADHFDLVLNGVELGGGSRRIHSAQMQEWIMREVLRMPEGRLAEFKHLFEALRAGCPPHAGMALGLDRMVAVMTGTESIRDVIAFPKNNRGEDIMVGSPSMMSEGQLATYQLAVVGKRDVGS
jgi:aspartyl-tRNA synthetase